MELLPKVKKEHLHWACFVNIRDKTKYRPLILCFFPPTSSMMALLFLSAGMEIMLVSL